MMRYIIFSIFSIFAYADARLDTLYQSGEFLKACEYGAGVWRTNEKDEKFMMIFGNACLKSDYIDYLAVPAVRLSKTKESREAAALYSTLVTKKKLLLMALMDGADLSNLTLPQAQHPLSIAFDKMVAKELKNVNGVWTDKNNSFGVSVIVSPKDKDSKTILITEANGTKRIMYK